MLAANFTGKVGSISNAVIIARINHVANLLLSNGRDFSDGSLLFHQRILELGVVNDLLCGLLDERVVVGPRLLLRIHRAIEVRLANALHELLQTLPSLLIIQLLLIKHLQVLRQAQLQRRILFFTISQFKIKKLLFIQQN